MSEDDSDRPTIEVELPDDEFKDYDAMYEAVCDTLGDERVDATVLNGFADSGGLIEQFGAIVDTLYDQRDELERQIEMAEERQQLEPDE